MIGDKPTDKEEREIWRKKAIDQAWKVWILSGQNCDLFYLLRLLFPEKKRTSRV